MMLKKIEVPMMLQYAEEDLGGNATREDYGKALEMTNKKFVLHTLRAHAVNEEQAENRDYF